MSNNKLEARVLTLARQYEQNYSSADLEKLLIQEWAKAEGSKVPVRSDESRALPILKRLQKNLQRYSGVSSATFAVIVSDVMEFLTASGYDVERFEIPAAIFVALIVQAILGEWNDDDNRPPPTDKTAGS